MREKKYVDNHSFVRKFSCISPPNEVLKEPSKNISDGIDLKKLKLLFFALRCVNKKMIKKTIMIILKNTECSIKNN